MLNSILILLILGFVSVLWILTFVNAPALEKILNVVNTAQDEAWADTQVDPLAELRAVDDDMRSDIGLLRLRLNGLEVRIHECELTSRPIDATNAKRRGRPAKAKPAPIPFNPTEPTEPPIDPNQTPLSI